MDPFLWLFSLCVAMFGGSFLAGNLPLMFILPQDKVRLISAYGAGLLVGTALIVVIPEGIETVYDSHSSEHEGTRPIENKGSKKKQTSINKRDVRQC
jgi:solute carrier family 39 (zinc transporter), member 9